MNFEKLFQYIKENLDHRLKAPYVSQDYTPEKKQFLYAGLRIALINADKKLTEEQIIDVFNAMNPEKRANMKFQTRKSSVAFLTDSSKFSEQGLLELLEWSEQHQAGYGPRFELVHKDNELDDFKTVKELRGNFGCQSNIDAAAHLFKGIKNEDYRLRFIPPFDSINPYIDLVSLTREELDNLERFKPQIEKYEIFDEVRSKFQTLIDQFNNIKNPSLVDIARFVKSMILLHPFPDGNGRTFTLGILNQLLLKNKMGICLNLDPRISLLSNKEIVQSIEANLISLKQFELEETQQQEKAVSFQDRVLSPNENKVSNLLELSESYRDYLFKEIREINRNNSISKLTADKYNAIDGLCRILEEDTSVENKLILFKEQFLKTRELISTRRDNAATIFLKGVLTFITVGVAAYLGIWDVKGKNLVKNIEEEVSKNASSSESAAPQNQMNF